MKVTEDELRAQTLRRQFPRLRGRGPTAVLELFNRLGPIQSQVPRTPFLSVAARLPGTTYATVTDLFESYQLVKTSNVRGTVHTSTRQHFSWLNAVAARTREGGLRNHLLLNRMSVNEVVAEIERFCAADWQPRKAIVAHTLGWIAARESNPAISQLHGGGIDNLIWGHSGLIRRPRDHAWEKRTDIVHRTARDFIDNIPIISAEESLRQLVRLHLAAYGPATRRDIAFFLGEGLGRVDGALAQLDDRLVRLIGTDGVTYLDLAEPPAGGRADPGLRLLPEFDGLLLGYHGNGRHRFIDRTHLDQVWARINGLFSPVVLHQGRLVASWKTITTGCRTDIALQMLPGHRPMGEDLLTGPIADLETILGLSITDVRISRG